MRVKTVADLKPDARNANRGTERGRSLLEKSLRKLGAGRSIVVDKNGRVIAGNKTLEVAAELGLPIEVIESDGRKLVVVQRKDLDLAKDPRARELAYADNRVSEIDLDWDADVIALDVSDGLVDLSGLFSEGELARLLETTAAAANSFQPNLEPEAGRRNVTQADVDKAAGKLGSAFEKRAQQSDVTNIVCPHCGETFGVSKGYIS